MNAADYRKILQEREEAAKKLAELRARFTNVIRLAGYGPVAVASILDEHFDLYMQDVPAFEAMLKEYEDANGHPD